MYLTTGVARGGGRTCGLCSAFPPRDHLRARGVPVRCSLTDLALIRQLHERLRRWITLDRRVVRAGRQCAYRAWRFECAGHRAYGAGGRSRVVEVRRGGVRSILGTGRAAPRFIRAGQRCRSKSRRARGLPASGNLWGSARACSALECRQSVSDGSGYDFVRVAESRRAAGCICMNPVRVVSLAALPSR